MGKVIKLQAVGGRLSNDAKRIRLEAFYGYAREFHCAALKTGSLLVRAYLLGHAIELYLKTFLLSEGAGEKKIKGLRHNLILTLDTCEKHGIANIARVSGQLRSDLTSFNKAYSSKALEYFSVRHLLVPPSLPPLQRLIRFAKVLERQVARTCVQT